MPRKSAATSGDGSTSPLSPRRSTRISSMPKVDFDEDRDDDDYEGGESDEGTKKRKRRKRTGSQAKVALTGNGSVTTALGEGGALTAEPSWVGAKGDVIGDGPAKKVKTTELEEKDELMSDISEHKTLSVGDYLPELTLKDDAEQDVKVQELANESGVVLFLVPKADTPGCNNQACGFRDAYTDFQAVGFKAYCVSADTTAAQSKWRQKFTFPYSLISDRNRLLITALGAADGKKTKRSHFIFEKGGKLVDIKIPVKPADSPKAALRFIKNHQQAPPPPPTKELEPEPAPEPEPEPMVTENDAVETAEP